MFVVMPTYLSPMAVTSGMGALPAGIRRPGTTSDGRDHTMDVGDMAKKAKDFAGEHPEQVDKAGDLAKDKLGVPGDKVDQGVDKAKQFLGNRDNQQDDDHQNDPPQQ